MNERHLRRILNEFVTHYNRGRPHSSLSPSLPEPSGVNALNCQGHQLPSDYRIRSKPVLGGLHHEYYLEKTKTVDLHACPFLSSGSRGGSDEVRIHEQDLVPVGEVLPPRRMC